MLIAVPLSDKEFRENLKIAKEEGADLIELRVDLFTQTDPDYVEDLVLSVKEEKLGTILTIRIPQEGGREVPTREEIFRKVSPLCNFVDLELRERNLIVKVKERLKKGKLILSYHNFEFTPPTWVLREFLREGHRYGAIPKIAVMPRSSDDVARLLWTAYQEKYPKILIAMGEIGRISRIAGFLFGSVISYASLKEALAPGQLSLKEMVKFRELFCKGEIYHISTEV